MGAHMIDIDYIRQLLGLFDESSVNELRIEQDGTTIRLSKTGKHEFGGMPMQNMFPPMPPISTAPIIMSEAPAMQAAPAPSAPTSVPVAAEVSTKTYHEIHSPIVGTFYRSPSPDSPVYVEVGASVSPGTVLCIVEAMKLMNEIECDVYGKVAKILVENGKPVEYNQPLFLIEPE